MSKSKPSSERGYAITRGTGRRPDDSVEDLDFEDTVPAQAGDVQPRNERPTRARAPVIPVERVSSADEAGVETAPEYLSNENDSDDDLTPDTLLQPREESDPQAMDQTLEVADVDEIGAGYSLDEAELARREHPQDGREHSQRQTR